MSSPPEELPDPVIMRIIRRFLHLASSIRTALGPFPLLNAGANRARRSPSPPQRATSSDANNASTSSEIDLDAKADGVDPSAELHGAARPTGLAARRRRQHQKRRQRQRAAADPDAKNSAADQERSVELDAATKYTAADSKNAAFAELDLDAKVKNRADSTPPSKNSWPSELDLDGKTTACNPKHAAPSMKIDPKIAKAKANEGDCSTKLDSKDRPPTSSDPNNDATSPELDLAAKSRKDAIAARKKRQRNNRRERRRAATDLGQERSAELDTAKATAPDPKQLGIVPGDYAPLEAPPVGDNDGLRGAALAVAATSTTKGPWNTVVSKKKRAPPAPPRPDPASAPAAPPRGARPSNSVPEHRSPAAAIVVRQYPAATVGLLDDLEGVDSFFDGMFDEPDEDEDRVRHLRYKEACSSLKKTQTYCLTCSLSDDNKKHPHMPNTLPQVTKHMNSAHKGGWIKCPQKGCYAMATNVRDINLHHYYAHEM